MGAFLVDVNSLFRHIGLSSAACRFRRLKEAETLRNPFKDALRQYVEAFRVRRGPPSAWKQEESVDSDRSAKKMKSDCAVHI